MLRDYQQKAIQDTYSVFRGDHRAMLQMPTGSGKTHVAMEMIKHGLKHDRRITFIADRISLIDQTFEKFYEAGIPCGVIQGEHPMYKPHMPVQVASVQTLARRREWLPSDLFIVDEAHCQYAAIQKQMEKWNALKWLGLSATPFTRGLGLTWQNMVTSISTADLIEQGHLSPYQAYGHTQPDLKGVRVRAGDYAIGDLEPRVRTIIGSVVQHYTSMCSGKKALGFAVSVAHAQELAAEFYAHGIDADYVCGHDTPERRREVLDSFRGDGTKVLFNCEVMTKGMDIPDIEVILLCRPTKSLSLHIQMCGRGLRTADGKDYCMFLDHAGNIERLGFPDDELPDQLCMREKGAAPNDQRKKDDPQPWNCPKCHHLIPPKTRSCPVCGFIAKAKAEVTVESGILKRLTTRGQHDKQEVYSQLVCVGQDRGYKNGWADHKYEKIFGARPIGLKRTLAVPTTQLRSWLKSEQIRYAKRRRQ